MAAITYEESLHNNLSIIAGIDDHDSPQTSHNVIDG